MERSGQTRSAPNSTKHAASRSVAFTGYRDAGAAAAGPRRRRRATPVRLAASATAAATAGTTRPSNIEGVMYSSESSPLDTMAASACAAASFISSFTRRARTSSIPRKKRSEEHTSELQSHSDLVCRLLLEKKKENDKTVGFEQNIILVYIRVAYCA